MANQDTSGAGSSRILVVDDNAMSRKVIAYRLQQDGYDVVDAASGAEALAIVENGPIGLIFLDLVMEGMGGMEVLGALKSEKATSGIPVVIVSGVEDRDAIADCMAAGAKDFLPKPVMAAVLQEIAADLVGPSPTAPTDDADKATPAVADEADVDIATLPVLHPSAISQLTKDYGKDTTAGFIARFEALIPGQRDAIAEAARAGNIGNWERAAHDVKGSARTLGLRRLAAVCRDIERACREGRADDALASTDGLDRHLDEALRALRDHTAA